MVQKKSRVVNIRWKAWYGDDSLNLFFPEKWNVTVYSIRGGEVITDKEIRKSFYKPIGSPPSQLAKGKKLLLSWLMI